MTQQNPYSFDRSFLPNPCDALYQDDVEISELPHIQELVQLAFDLEDQLSGDFNLEFLMFQIADNSLAFVKSGLIYFKIKALKLYSGVCKTFKQFCNEKLGYSVWQVNNQIKASRVVMTLVAAGFEQLPKNELQCRTLRSCCESEEELVQAWQSVVDNIEPHKITAKTIRNHLKPEEEKEVPETEKIEVPYNLFETIYRNAVLAKMTVVELLHEIFQPTQNCDNCWHFDKKIERWQEDLEKLVSEQQKSTG